MMGVTGVEISWACLSARKETLETFKFRDYQTALQPHGHDLDGAIRSSGGFQQMIVILCITAKFAQIMTWRFTGEDLAEECYHLAVACSIMPAQTQARCKSLVKQQKQDSSH